MTIRRRNTTVTFRRPFRLSGIDEVLPAGAYNIETDEELLAGNSVPAYRRILTLIHLHAEPGNNGVRRLLPVDPGELDVALERDQALTETPALAAATRNRLDGAKDSRRNDADRQDLDRAENEGMFLRST